MQNIQIESTINALYEDSKNDYLKMVKGMARSIFRPMQPSDLKEAYLAISKEQGIDLTELIIENDIKNVVEFGSSFGISTLFLAKGVKETGGKIITTELIEEKALRALENFKIAGVRDLIEVRIGDAMDTLKDFSESIDLLLLDGWKDLYYPLFKMLEPNFHEDTIIYVDNADMAESRLFINNIRQNPAYQIKYEHNGKVVLISKRRE